MEFFVKKGFLGPYKKWASNLYGAVKVDPKDGTHYYAHDKCRNNFEDPAPTMHHIVDYLN